MSLFFNSLLHRQGPFCRRAAPLSIWVEFCDFELITRCFPGSTAYMVSLAFRFISPSLRAHRDARLAPNLVVSVAAYAPSLCGRTGDFSSMKGASVDLHPDPPP